MSTCFLSNTLLKLLVSYLVNFIHISIDMKSVKTPQNKTWYQEQDENN